MFWILGYGFVDFESPACAEGAVKGLQSKGIQAQMAKVGIWMLHRPAIVRLFCMQVIFNPPSVIKLLNKVTKL